MLATLKTEVEGMISQQVQTLRAALDAQGADFTQRSEATVVMLRAEAQTTTAEMIEKRLVEMSEELGSSQKALVMEHEASLMEKITERETAVATNFEELEDALAAIRLEDKATAAKIEELDGRHHISTPGKGGSNPGYFSDKADRIKTLSMDKIGLDKFGGDPAKFKDWRESLDIDGRHLARNVRGAGDPEERESGDERGEVQRGG